MKMKVGQRYMDQKGNHIVVKEIFNDYGVEKARVLIRGQPSTLVCFVFEYEENRLATRVENLMYEV